MGWIDFERQIDRHNTDSVKWDGQGGDFLPLWVADMDFAIAEPIMEAIRKRVEHPFFGYSFPGNGVYDAIIQYYKKRYQAEVKKEWIVFIHGVNIGNNIAARALGGTIMVTTPMYPHINQNLPKEAEKPIIRVPLKEENNSFTFDFPAMEKAVTKEVTTFILCNPHNPVGRVYTRQELQELLDFTVQHELVIVADEIHSDLILDGEHIPAFTLGEEAKKRVIVHHSASKTYNLPGLPAAFAIIPDKKLRERYQQVANTMSSPFSPLSFIALEAAFSQGEPWRKELLGYLRENRRYLDERMGNIKGLHVYPGQGTYLAWVDARGTGKENPSEFFRKQAGVNVNDGKPFSAEGFVRMNFACPREILRVALDKVEQALG